MDSIVEMAKLFKERENKTIQGICIGKVVSPLPEIKITVNGFVLTKAELVIAKQLIGTYTSSGVTVGDHGDHFHTISDGLQSGEKVIVIPSVDNSTYFIIDKVGDI